MSEILRVEGVGLAFGGLRALHDVSITVNRGEAVALVGPNGSGKSTLLNVISGFYTPKMGKIWFEGEDVAPLARFERARRGIARTFQNARVFPRLTAREHLIVPGVRSMPRIQPDELLDVVGYVGPRGTPAGSLAYGHRRLVEVARALALEPRLLLLDEPTAGLNGSEVEAFQESLEGVRARFGLTLIVVEHKMDFLEVVCGRMVVLREGEVLCDLPPADALRDPRVRDAYLGAQ